MRPKGERDLGRQGAGRDDSGRGSTVWVGGSEQQGALPPRGVAKGRERKWRGGRWPNFNLLLGRPEEDGIYSMQ